MKTNISFQYILAVLLVWWSIFPLFSFYTRAIGFLIIFLLWICFSGILFSRSLIKSFLFKATLLLIHFSILFVFQIIGYGSGLVPQLISMFYVMIYLLVFEAYKNDNFAKKIFFKAMLISYTITSVITISILISDPNASRLIYGSDTNNKYMQIGVGHYSFIYSLALIIPILLQQFILNKRLIYVFLLLLYTVNLLLASYTIATIAATIFVLIVIFVNVKKSKLFYFIFLFLILIVISLTEQSWVDIVSIVPSDMVKKKLIELIGFIYNGDLLTVSSLRERIILYNTSWSSFTNNLFLGVGGFFGVSGYNNLIEIGVGGHSDILDNLARFGIVLSIPFFGFVYSLIKETKKIHVSYYLMFLVFFFGVGLVNPVMGLSLVVLLMFVPFWSDERSINNEDRNSNFSLSK